MDKLRIDLLTFLRSSAQYGLDATLLLQDAREARHRSLSLPELEAALRDLADRSYVTPYTSALGAQRWRITALGESALQEAGL